MSDLRTYIAQLEQVKRWGLAADVVTPESVLLKHGRPWTPAPQPSGIRFHGPQECFRNAWYERARRPGTQYVEGYAAEASYGIPVAHAWLVDPEGLVIDPTWRTAGREYFGVPFDHTWVSRTIFRNKYWGVLYENPDIEMPPEVIIAEPWRSATV